MTDKTGINRTCCKTEHERTQMVEDTGRALPCTKKLDAICPTVHIRVLSIARIVSRTRQHSDPMAVSHSEFRSINSMFSLSLCTLATTADLQAFINERVCKILLLQRQGLRPFLIAWSTVDTARFSTEIQLRSCPFRWSLNISRKNMD